MRNFERNLKNKIRYEIADLSEITPGLHIEVIRKGEVRANLRIGDTYQYYDLASLTKILFSATAWTRWVSKSDFDLNLPAYFFLTWWHHRKTSVKSLMT